MTTSGTPSCIFRAEGMASSTASCTFPPLRRAPGSGSASSGSDSIGGRGRRSSPARRLRRVGDGDMDDVSEDMSLDDAVVFERTLAEIG